MIHEGLFKINLNAEFEYFQIRDVYRRATTHHLPDKLDIHLKYAGFEERRGEFGRAAEILRDLEQKHHPEMLSLMLRRCDIDQKTKFGGRFSTVDTFQNQPRAAPGQRGRRPRALLGLHRQGQEQSDQDRT